MQIAQKNLNTKIEVHPVNAGLYMAFQTSLFICNFFWLQSWLLSIQNHARDCFWAFAPHYLKRLCCSMGACGFVPVPYFNLETDGWLKDWAKQWALLCCFGRLQNLVKSPQKNLLSLTRHCPKFTKHHNLLLTFLL